MSFIGFCLCFGLDLLCQLYIDSYIGLINPRLLRMRSEGYCSRFVCVCVCVGCNEMQVVKVKVKV